MGLTSKFGLLFGIALGLFVVLVVFGNLVGPPAVRQVDEKISQLPLLTPVARLEPSRYFNPASSENLTRKLAAVIGKNIVESNPQGPQTVPGEKDQLLNVAAAEKIAEDAVSQALRTFDLKHFQPEIARADLKIDQQQTEAGYQQQLVKILRDNIDPRTDWKNASPENLARLIGSYNILLNQLYKLAVPETLAGFHQQLLKLFNSQKLVLEAFKNAANDPLQAIMAVEASQTINQELKEHLQILNG